MFPHPSSLKRHNQEQLQKLVLPYIYKMVQETPYDPLTNNCIHKSIRFADLCKKNGIHAEIKVRPLRLFGVVPLPLPHFYTEVRGVPYNPGENNWFEES